MSREWLEADGLGGFASGPVEGPRTRRYHALLLAAEGPRRFVLVNGVDAHVATDAGEWPLTAQRYEGGASVAVELESYANEPWPTWVWRLPDGTRVRHELFVRHGHAETHARWHVLHTPSSQVTLRVRPFLSGRDYHAIHHENSAFEFTPTGHKNAVNFRPYPGVPPVSVVSNGLYQHDPCWYRRFFYEDEAARGLDAVEDLAAPGVWRFDLHAGEARLVFATSDASPMDVRDEELSRRSAFASPLHRAADQYVVARAGGGKTLIAGYPWFTDWGRDTFIAVRGLCLATGAVSDAREILLRWADAVSEGMLPNRFPDGDGAPEYNSVDAALWYVVAAYELLRAHPGDRARIGAAIERILDRHASGTRHGIHMTADGLLAAGAPGVQLTWMDSKIGEWVVTPRSGKPVEIQALWLNALWIGGQLDLPSAARWQELLARGRGRFAARFWDQQAGHLRDVVDVCHREGVDDNSLRPNQLLAIGGLPLPLLDGPRARAVVDVVEAQLVTPIGVRSLSPSDPAYRPTYDGDMRSRDSAYHQGTVWPWLMGPFVEAWVRVRGGSPDAKAEARRRFLVPLRAHLNTAGVGHLCEVADGAPPHRPGGCPFQAWSLGELVRLERLLNGQTDEPSR